MGHSCAGGTAGCLVVVVHTETCLDHHIAVEILVSTVLVYVWDAGLWVALLSLHWFQLLLTALTGKHVIRQTAHLPHTEAPLTRLRTSAPVCVVPHGPAGLEVAALLIKRLV